MMTAASQLTSWLDRLVRRVYELPATSGRFDAMEGLRAYAALLVFMVHYLDAYGNQVLNIDFNTVRLGQSEDAWINVLCFLFASHYGVDIFFLLSGFLIAKIVARSGFNYRNFLWHRVRRVYPAFFISLLIWTYLRVVVQQAYAFDPTQFLGNLLFLNALPQLDVKPYAVMTWSLFYEFAFYLSFPILFLMAKRNRSLRPTTLILVSALFILTMLQFDIGFIRFLMFFGGVTLAYSREPYLIGVAQRLREKWVVLAYLASTLSFAYLPSYEYFTPIFVVTAALLVVKALYGNGWLNRMFSWRPLRYLGNVSFSFYLLHGLGIDLVMDSYPNLFVGFSGLSYLIVTMTASLATGVVFATLLFLIAEKPYFNNKLVRPAFNMPQRVLS